MEQRQQNYTIQVSQVERKPEFVLKKDFFIASRQQDIRKYYQFIPKFIGRGAYGIVYRARMMQPPHSERAVKIIPKVLIKNPENLINEVSILKKLDHPNIIKLYETFEDKEHFYLVLDYCEGGQLFGRIAEQGIFSENDARNIFTQIVKILKYLHSQKIAHRDLKPENFLMYSKSSFSIRIIDFGLSYQFSSDMRAQLKSKQKNKLLGTSYYIAPEVINLNYDQRCDIWAAGVMLYILATSSPPFDGANDTEILENISKLNYSFEIPEAQSISPEMKDLIKKILVPESQRISLDGILQHPWMNIKLPLQKLQLNYHRMKQFISYTKLKTIAVTYIASQMPEKQIHQLSQTFKQIDQNNDGYLTVEELKRALDRQRHSASLKELNSIISTIDTDKNGRINYNEFVACCLENSVINNENYLQNAFRTFDTDHDGKISSEEFKKILENSNLDQQMISNYIEEIMKDSDKDHDGGINYLEFLDCLGFESAHTNSLPAIKSQFQGKVRPSEKRTTIKSQSEKNPQGLSKENKCTSSQQRSGTNLNNESSSDPRHPSDSYSHSPILSHQSDSQIDEEDNPSLLMSPSEHQEGGGDSSIPQSYQQNPSSENNP